MLTIVRTLAGRFYIIFRNGYRCSKSGKFDRLKNNSSGTIQVDAMKDKSLGNILLNKFERAQNFTHFHILSFIE